MADSNVEYLRLITSEYADKPNYNAFVEAFLKKVSPINDCLTSFDVIFNLDNAAGDQLDWWGDILNVSRELPVSDPDIPSVLTDDLYRIVLKARIYANTWDGTIDGLRNIIDTSFENVVYQIVDAQDMSMQVVLIIPDADPALIALLLNGFILPKPSGVNVSYTIQENALFGWDSNTSFIKGWDEGIWSDN